jgi:hypothetical protein
LGVVFQQPAKGLAAQFGGAIFASHYWVVIFGIQVLGALLLLLNRFVVLALVLLGPVIVNILFFHVLMAPEGIPMAAVVVVLWLILAVRYRQYLAGIFVQRAASYPGGPHHRDESSGHIHRNAA